MAKTKSDEVMTTESAITCLTTQSGATVISTLDSIELKTGIGDETETLSTVTGNVRFKMGQVTKGDDGNYWGKVYIPPDNSSNKAWDKSFYAYVNMGTDDNFNFILPLDSDNKNYIKQEKVKDNYETDKNDLAKTSQTYFVNSARVVNKAVTDVSALAENIIIIQETGGSLEDASQVAEEALVTYESEYVPEDFWAESPNAGTELTDDDIDAMMRINSLRYIFGVPYQFLPTADMRLGGDEDNTFGYTYAEKVASRMPILYITPGNPAFMAGADNEDKQNFLYKAWSKISGNEDSELMNMNAEYSGKIYSLKPSYVEYYEYVHVMTKTGAVMLGLCQEGRLEKEYGENYCKLDGVWCSDYNWAFTDNSDYAGTYDGSESTGEGNTGVAALIESADTIAKKAFYHQVIPFYITSEFQYSDSFGNETTESILASTINGFSDKAREMQFLLGTTQSVIAENFDALGDLFADSKAAIDQFTAKLGGQGNIFSNLLNNVRTVASGGRLMFPNIWSNSTFSKSYQVNIKLTTPYYDPKSWWLNIYVPLCHLLALCLPRGEFHNGYAAPFLVKAFYTGTFNIDTGIITELTVAKGKEGGWTKDGLPTVVDVSFTIQDLYPTISMSPDYLTKKDTLQNIQELDYLSSLCGININEPDARRMLTYYATMAKNTVTDIPFRLVGNLSQNITSRVAKLFSIY